MNGPGDEPPDDGPGDDASRQGESNGGFDLGDWLTFSAKVMFYAVAGADTEKSIREYHSGLQTEERINKRRLELAQERAGLRLWRTVIVIGSAIIPIAFIWLVPEWDDGDIQTIHWRLGATMAYFLLFLLINLLFVRARVGNLNAQLHILDYEAATTTFEAPHEKRAASLFFKHQAELKQYYDQTLRQNRQAFALGIVCVAFGLGAIVAVATLVLAYGESTTAAKITAGGLGILSALLTGFVARIYLRVYEESAGALGSFHDRLVNTHHYHFANLLISTIKSESAREQATGLLSQAITSSQSPIGSED